ncbi:MAG: hypothetical protein QOE90_1662 [Thermoplasmata archaeon]|nr:hypothetical protein [Thermoplasmata archaeon]
MTFRGTPMSPCKTCELGAEMRRPHGACARSSCPVALIHGRRERRLRARFLSLNFPTYRAGSALRG